VTPAPTPEPERRGTRPAYREAPLPRSALLRECVCRFGAHSRPRRSIPPIDPLCKGKQSGDCEETSSAHRSVRRVDRSVSNPADDPDDGDKVRTRPRAMQVSRREVIVKTNLMVCLTSPAYDIERAALPRVLRCGCEPDEERFRVACIYNEGCRVGSSRITVRGIYDRGSNCSGSAPRHHIWRSSSLSGNWQAAYDKDTADRG
jgi:hypothetical protein